MARMQETIFKQVQLLTIYAASQQEILCNAHAKEKIMTKRSTFSAIGEFLDLFGSAVAVSNAVENRRQPASRDLRNLGIDPAEFRKMGRF
jgi:hypothetical protein